MGWRLGARGWSQNEDSSSIWPQPQASSPIASELAGAEGFEPPNGGIKTRCLTTWRRPNVRSNRLDAVVELQAHAVACSIQISLLGQPVQKWRAVHASDHEALPARRKLRQNRCASALIADLREHASAGSSQLCRPEITKPIKGFCDIGIAPAHGRSAIVAATPCEEGAYCRDG